MKSLLGLCLLFTLGACSSFHREPLPPGSVADKLEHAGERYQASEAEAETRPKESNPSNH